MKKMVKQSTRISEVFIFYALVFLLFILAHGSAQAAITASRTTGVAPLGVSFTACVTASTSGNRPFHDLDYAWDFDDPSGNVWVVSGKSKDTAQGPVTAHVFETPGTYTIKLTTSGLGGQISVETVQITVQDPDVVYSGTNTICISDTASNDFAGCPNGAQQITTDDIADIKSAVASDKRILLHRGSSWNSDGVDIDEKYIGSSSTGVTFGAYGNCTNPDERGICENAPVFNLNYPIPYADKTRYKESNFFSMSQSGDCRVRDITFAANQNYTCMAGGSKDIGPFLFLRLKTTGFRSAISTSLFQSTGHDQLMVVDSDFSEADSNVMYAGSENMVVMGNSFRDAFTSHVVRIWQTYAAIISHNRFSGSSLNNDSGRHALKVHGFEEEKLTDQYGTRKRTRFVVVADNVFGTSGYWTVGFGPQDALHDEQLTDIIVENNRFFADYGNLSSCLVDKLLIVWARYVSVRNNIFDGNGSAKAFSAMVIEQRGIEPAPTGVVVSNNTIYKTDVTPNANNMYVGVQVQNIAGDIDIFNNLLVFPEDSQEKESYVIRNIDGSALTSSHNLLIQGTDPGLSNPDHISHLQRDFSLLENSPAIDQGMALPVFRDLTGSYRPVNVIDVGAYEYAPEDLSDLNDDRFVNLVDLVLVLKIVSGNDITSGNLVDKDINGDNRIGLAEAILIMRKIAGL